MAQDFSKCLLKEVKCNKCIYYKPATAESKDTCTISGETLNEEDFRVYKCNTPAPTQPITTHSEV